MPFIPIVAPLRVRAAVWLTLEPWNDIFEATTATVMVRS
jgi:hypothetical protein